MEDLHLAHLLRQHYHVYHLSGLPMRCEKEEHDPRIHANTRGAKSMRSMIRTLLSGVALTWPACCQCRTTICSNVLHEERTLTLVPAGPITRAFFRTVIPVSGRWNHRRYPHQQSTLYATPCNCAKEHVDNMVKTVFVIFKVILRDVVKSNIKTQRRHIALTALADQLPWNIAQRRVDNSNRCIV